ncbi:MAG TPA: ribosome biogenesis factor YjgA [Steroidobacteraceae bacterium]|nr:ribosome biogenesis factor YjgA [Steroidobacteraceae bacterium]
MGEDEDNTEDGDVYISRSQRKRRAEALQRLGVRLTTLRPGRLQKLQLPPELLDALMQARQLRSRAALARQRQFIGRLMRGLDPAALERAQAEVADTHDAKMPR